MGAKVPETIDRENLGSVTLIMGKFAGATTENSIDDGDTWTSNVPSIIAQWANGTNAPTTNTQGIDVGLTTPASGVLTFQTGSADRQAIVFILARN